jgi:hypothetical protein
VRGLASENLHKTGHRRLWTQAVKRSRSWPYLNEIALRRSCSFLPAMLTSRVAKRVAIAAFVVETTNFGWSVRAGTQRMALFVSQRQALEEVKKRRAELTARRQRSTIIVTGSEPVTKGRRY